jgi:hypothetical protein
VNRITRFAAGLLAPLALVVAVPLTASAFNPPSLGGAGNFAVLGGAGVTCTASTVTGNVGSKLTVTRTPTCSVAGGIHHGDATAVGAFNNFLTAYTSFNALPCGPGKNLTGQPLGGKTLAPGVYCFATTADLTTGILTLRGPSSGVWVFKVGTGITTGTAQVVMAGGASACNVYWVLGTAATIGTSTKFQGNILAGSAVTFTGTNSSLKGRALAKTAVTMTGTTISGCDGTVVGPPGNDGDKDGNEDHQDDHGDGNHNGGDHNDGDHGGGDHHGGD